jgi:hypothetical protein
VQNGARRPDFESTIHLPKAGQDAPNNDLACRVVAVDGHRMRLQSAQAIPPSVPISVEHDDALYLGEVVNCLARDCVYEVDMDIEQVLTGLQSLVSLRARLLDEQDTALRNTPVEHRCRLAGVFDAA